MENSSRKIFITRRRAEKRQKKSKISYYIFRIITTNAAVTIAKPSHHPTIPITYKFLIILAKRKIIKKIPRTARPIVVVMVSQTFHPIRILCVINTSFLSTF